MVQEDGSVRRIDLDLRKEVYGLKTRIYKVSNTDYQILCENLKEVGYENLDELQGLFNHQVRYVGTPVRLVNTPPEKYINEVDPISLENPVYGFKYSAITEPELEELINSLFPDIDIRSITCHPGMGFYINIDVSTDTSDEQIAKMQTRLYSLDLGTDDIRIGRTSAERVEQKEHFTPYGKSLNIRTNREYGFSVGEADYWLSNAENIYDGNLKRSDMPYYRAKQKNCYIDASVFECADIRKAILLYDTVYLGMPIEDHLDAFLSSQRIKRNELIELCERGKLVLVLNGDEKRYDKKILDEVYGNSPLNVVGQRGINTLLASYFVDIDERFKRNYPGIDELISDLYKFGYKDSGADVLRSQRCNSDGSEESHLNTSIILADALSWPSWARAESFRVLNTRAPVLVSSCGVNQLVLEWTNLLKDNKKREGLQFEYLVNGYQMHIAMALNSTYMPFFQTSEGEVKPYSDYQLAASLERLLSFYWYGPGQYQQIANMTEKADLELKLFDARDMSVTKIAEAADDNDTPMRFGKLIDELALLPEDKRGEKIRFFNDMLFELEKPSNKASIIDWALTGAGFLPLSYAQGCALNILSLLLDKLSSTNMVKEQQRRETIKKTLLANVKEANESDIDDIDILDKINRVVSLRDRTRA